MGGWRDLMIACVLGEGYMDAFIKTHIPSGKLDYSFLYQTNDNYSFEFCVARMAFTLTDLQLLENLLQIGSCEFQCIDRSLIHVDQEGAKRSLSASAGHFLYKSNIENEQNYVSKFKCPNLLDGFI